MRKAVKSDNPLHAEINKYYRINRSYWLGTKTEAVNGIETEVPRYSTTKITSANALAKLIDEKTKIKAFKRVLDTMPDEYTMLIRQRLKIKFHLK